MKRFFKWAKKKIVDFVKWVWQECKDWRTFVLFVVVCLVIGAPVWVLALLGLIFGWEWALIAAGVVWAFWMLPGAPYFAVCIATTLAIKRFFEKKAEKQIKQKTTNEAEASLQDAESTDPITEQTKEDDEKNGLPE